MAMPPMCVKCGEPSTGTLAKSFYWHAPWLYVFIVFGLILYAILAIIVRKRLDLKVPLCTRHRRRRRNAILLAWFLFLGGIGLPIALSAAGVDPGGSAFLVMPLAVLAAIFVGFGVARVLVPTEIDDGGGTFKGAGRAYLDKLP
jgi:hypothetical protein